MSVRDGDYTLISLSRFVSTTTANVFASQLSARALPRSRILKVRLFDEEYSWLKAFAKKHHATISEVIRSFIAALSKVEQNEPDDG
jgi:hypothetical protein